MKLSNRLQLVADFVTKGNILADIGTDHGYIPVYLVMNDYIPRAYAMDIGKGPLERAREHINEYKLVDRIETRLSNGLDKLLKGEADTVLIAGMGGALTVDILHRGKEVLDTVKEVILSPHSEWELVRNYMVEEGYEILREEMIIDAGKYYVVMKWKKGEDKINKDEEYTKEELLYGKLLLKNKDMVLKEYLLKEKDNYQKILDSLNSYGKDNVDMRRKEIELSIDILNQALLYYV